MSNCGCGCGVMPYNNNCCCGGYGGCGCGGFGGCGCGCWWPLLFLPFLFCCC